VLRDLRALPTLVASADGLDGVLTYEVSGDRMEVVSIDAVTPRRGVGSALLRAAAATAAASGCRELWLVTTNDNLDALRFYQRRGMRITGVAPDAVAASRDEIMLSLSIE